jgi:hypothetical protein
MATSLLAAGLGPTGVFASNFSTPLDPLPEAPDLTAWRTTQSEKLDAIALDPEKSFEGRDLSFARDPEQGKRLAINDAFLQLHGEDDEEIPTSGLSRDLLRVQLAERHFQGRGAENEDAFHGEIVKAAQGRKDRKDLGKALTEEAFKAVTLGGAGEKSATFQEWRETAKSLPGYDPDMEADYFEAWHGTQREARERIEPFKDELGQVWQAMKAGGAGTASTILKAVGSDLLLGTQDATLDEIKKKDAGAVAFEIYKNLGEGEREDFMAGLDQLVKSFPKEEQASVLANLGKSGGRMVDDLGRGVFGRFTLEGLQQNIDADAVKTRGPYAATDAEKADARTRLDQSLLQKNFADSIRRIERGEYDPVKFYSKPSDDVLSWRTAEEGLYAVPGVLAFAGTTLAPGGAYATFLAMEDFAYGDLRDNAIRAGASEINASRFADEWKTATAIPQTALEMLQNYGAVGRLPAVNKALNAMGDQITNRLIRGAVKTGAIGLSETTIEEFQHLTPYLTQELSGALELDTGIPRAEWENGKDGAFDGFWKRQATTFISMLPLAVFGGMGGLNAEARDNAFKKASTTQLQAFGGTAEGIAAINGANTPSELRTAVEGFMATRDPNSEEARLAVESEAVTIEEQKAAVRSGVFPDIVQSGDTKELVAEAPDLAGAMRVAEAHSAALHHKRAEKVAYLATMLEAGEEALAMASDPEAVNNFELGTLFTEAMAEAESPGTIDQFRMQAENRERVNGGDGSVTRIALGRNVTEARDMVRSFTNRLFRGASVQTVVHETGHGMLKRARAAGVITREDELAFVRATDSLMGTSVLKRGSQKGERLALLDPVLTDEQITEGMLDEAIQEILEAEILRTRKRGKTEKPLRVSNGIISRNLLALSRLAPNATRKFRALIEAARGVFGLSSARALKMKQGAREGTFDEAAHEAFLAKLTGRDWQAEHDGIIRDEHAAIMDSKPAELTENEPFSLAPSRMVEALEINAAARIKDPEVKARIFERLIEKLGKLKRDQDELKIAFGKGYKRKAINDPRGVETIRKDYGLRKEAAREQLEQAANVLSPDAIRSETSRRTAIRAAELEEQAYAKHEGIWTNPDLVKLKEWPVHQYLADPNTPLRGRLKSKSRALRDSWFDNSQGDFDGADGVPRANFGGNLMPDQAAQELFDNGLIKQPTADAMWDALKKEAAQVPKFREYLKAAKADLSAAREQARAELQTWARGERIKRQELEEAQKESDAALNAEMEEKLKEEDANYSPRQRLLRALAMLDAMLSVLPAEVRGKVGGYVQLAKLSSDEARLKFLDERVEKIEEALNAFLGKEYRAMLDKLIEAGKPKKDVAGKKRKGHLGPEAHRFFDRMNAALDLNEAELKSKLDQLDEDLANEGDPEILADLAEEWQILRTFGNFDAKTALEKHDAVAMAQKVYDTGRNGWRMTEEARLAEVRAAALSARGEAGNGDVRDIQEAKRKGRTTVAALTEKHWNLRSFREVLDLAFGEGSATAERFGNGARRAFTARTKAMINLQRRWKDAMEKATGKKGRAARQQVYDMQAIQSIEELVSPEIYDEIKIPIDTFFDAENRASLDLSPEEVVILTEQFENFPPNSRRKYLILERQVKTGTGAARMVKFTEAEAIHLTMLWAQADYKAALKKHGFGADFQDLIEAKLSPAAKELRQWLVDYYRDSFPALAALYKKMYGVDLRQIENYAPGTFWHTGSNETPVDPSAGVVTGGNFKAGMGNGGDFAEGFLKQRKKHKAVPRIGNAFDLFFNHANQSEHWKAMAELSREMHGVFGQPDVKIAMEARSPAAANAVREWLKAIDGNGVAMAASGKLMKYLLESQAYMAMAWKASTATKNLVGAAVNAAYGMPLHEYVRGMAKLVRGRLEFGEMLASEPIQNKLNGGYAPEVRAAVSQALNGKPTWRADMLIRGLEIHGKADAFGNAIGGTIAFDYHYRKGLSEGLSEKQARTVAMELTADSIARFSQPAEIIDRSLFELNLGTFGKLMFLFASEARQKSSLYLTALGHTVTGKPTRKDIRVLFIAHLVMAPLMQAVAAGFRDAFDPDDDEWLDEKYWNPMDFLKAAATGPFAGIPLIRDVFSGFTGSNSPLSSYKQAGEGLVDLFAEEPRGDEIEWYEAKINKVLHGVGAAPGVAANLYKQIAGAVRNAIPD